MSCNKKKQSKKPLLTGILTIPSKSYYHKTATFIQLLKNEIAFPAVPCDHPLCVANYHNRKFAIHSDWIKRFVLVKPIQTQQQQKRNKQQQQQQQKTLKQLGLNLHSDLAGVLSNKKYVIWPFSWQPNKTKSL